MLSSQFRTLRGVVPRILSGILMCAGWVAGLPIGCATTVWEHPEKGTANLQEDLAQCEERARHAAQEGDPHTGNVLSMQDHLNECLEARGYLKRPGVSRD